AGSMHRGVADAHIAKLPPGIEDTGVGRCQDGWIAPEGRGKGRRVPPLVLLVLPRARSAELRRVSDQVHAAVDGITRPVDGHGDPALEIPVLSQLPIA